MSEQAQSSTASQLRWHEAPWLRRLGRVLVGEGKPTYYLTRFLMLRLLGLVYAVAFFVGVEQLIPLVGEEGLLPADLYLAAVEAKYGVWEGFWKAPTLFWFALSDGLLLAVAWLGGLLSLVVLAGYANAILLFVLWLLYFSIVSIGQNWYSFGWEMQLLETGMLAVFLCPLLDGRPFSPRPPPLPILWLYRWMTFRIMLGAGLIKIRGDICWRDFTCLQFHYETQPVPNGFSRFLHFLPDWFHWLGVAYNHLVELIAPLFVFWPQLLRHGTAVLMIGFQLFLIFSGNLSFLNWLTIVPMLALVDDSLWRRLLPKFLVRRAEQAAAESKPSKWHTRVAWGYVVIVALLSIPVVSNLVSPGQAMNQSFDPLRLVNTYGAFGSVGKERYEIVIEGTSDLLLTRQTVWKEYAFKVKPGDLERAPSWISPWHYRLDWLAWFAAMATPEHYPWSVHLVWKLLHNDAGTLRLLDGNPFPEDPPRHVRILLYRYRFAEPGNEAGHWWERELVREWLRPMHVNDIGLQRFVKAYGWVQ